MMFVVENIIIFQNLYVEKINFELKIEKYGSGHRPIWRRRKVVLCRVRIVSNVIGRERFVLAGGSEIVHTVLVNRRHDFKFTLQLIDL